MSVEAPKPGNFMDTISKIMSSKENPELDKTMEALMALKGEVEVKAAFDEDWKEIPSDLMKDLDKEALWKKLWEGVKVDMLDQSPEKQKIETFLKNPDTFGKLNKIIDSIEDRSKLKDAFKAATGVGIMATLTGWIDSLKKSDSAFTKGIGEMLGSLLGAFQEDEEKSKEVEKPEVKPAPNTDLPAPTQNEASEVTPEQNEHQQFIEGINALNDEIKFAEIDAAEYAKISKEKGGKEKLIAQINEASKKEGKLGLLQESIQSHDGLNEFKFDIKDLKVSEADMKTLAEFVSGAADTGYQLEAKELTPKKLRDILTALRTKQGLEQYKK